MLWADTVKRLEKSVLIPRSAVVPKLYEKASILGPALKLLSTLPHSQWLSVHNISDDLYFSDIL